MLVVRKPDWSEGFRRLFVVITDHHLAQFAVFLNLALDAFAIGFRSFSRSR